jgi:hypothetical protein
VAGQQQGPASQRLRHVAEFGELPVRAFEASTVGTLGPGPLPAFGPLLGIQPRR